MTVKQAREFFDYNPKTGDLIWKKQKPHGKSKPGDIVGKNSIGKYRQVTFDHIGHRAHRVCWAVYYGFFPYGHIDHINGDGRDNRIKNLRDVSRTQNNLNQKAHRDINSTIGTSFEKARGLWLSSICIGGKSIFIGRFKTRKQAKIAYLKKYNELVINNKGEQKWTSGQNLIKQR